MKKKNLRISDLFYNNRFLLVFSIVVAVIVWLVVAVEFSPETTQTIKNVPVKIDYSEIKNNLGGLQPFGETDFTVDVTVSGQKIVVESDSIADSINVTASTGYVNSVGNYDLQINVEGSDEYKIVGVSPELVQVYFDYPREKEFKIETDVTFDSKAVEDGYFMDDFVLSDTNTVKVSGPESEINKIERIVAKAEHEGSMRQSDTVDGVLTAVTKDGSTLKYVSFKRQSEKVQITIPVYKIATLPVTCAFSNIPAEYLDSLPFEVSISPATATFGIPENQLENKTSFELSSKIDFSKLNVGQNVFTVSVTDNEISGGIVLDETKEFVITVTVKNMGAKTISAPSTMGVSGVPAGLTAELSKLNFSVLTVIGPEEQLGLLNADNLVLTADFSNIDENASDVVTVPVRLSNDSCWSFGEYTATFTIS